MLKIKKDQLPPLEAPMRERFVDKAVAYLEGAMSERGKTAGPAELRELVRRGMLKASRYGISAESEVILLVDLMSQLGPDFERQRGHEWIEATLANVAMTPRERLKLICTRLDRMDAKG